MDSPWKRWRKSSQESVKLNQGVTKEDEWVYDIEVEDNHNYFAGDVLVSNSAFKGKKHDEWSLPEGEELEDAAPAGPKPLKKPGAPAGGPAPALPPPAKEKPKTEVPPAPAGAPPKPPVTVKPPVGGPAPAAVPPAGPIPGAPPAGNA